MENIKDTIRATESQRRKHDGLAKHNYPNWHEMKDLVAIYREREWDDAEVVVWDPELQKYRKLVFCGSTRPDDEHVGEINFTVTSFSNKNRNYNED